MKNFILGSGIVGSVAKRIFGDRYEWIPFKRSRYYGLKTLTSEGGKPLELPLADNFIVYDDAISDVVYPFCQSKSPIIYKRPFSYMGQLMYNDHPMQYWLKKVYGDKIPSLAEKLIRTNVMVYHTTVHNMLDKIVKSNENAYADSHETYGEMISIDFQNKIIICANGRFEFDKLISTIPFDALLRFGKRSTDFLKARSECFYHISVKHDMEGATQALVADVDIDFHKVQKIDNNMFVFHTMNAIPEPYQYFGSCFGYNIDIIEAKRIENSIPIGEPPDLAEFEKIGIYCVGSNAQWDDMMDVSSCIKRLVKLSV